MLSPNRCWCIHCCNVTPRTLRMLFYFMRVKYIARMTITCFFPLYKDIFFLQIDEQFWNEGCSQHCKCFAPEDLRCISTSCSSTEECVVKNGALGCYSPMSTCMVSGDPHYYTFDGAVAHFQVRNIY